MQELILMVGNIGSGKSTIAAKYAKRGYVVINNDAITTMVQGGEYGMYDPEKWMVYKNIANSGIRTALENGFSVVVDRTNVSKRKRAEYINMARAYRCNTKAIDFGSGSEECLQRRILNSNGVTAKKWDSVFMKFKEQYEEPSQDEGLDIIEKAPEDYYFYAFDFDGTIVYDDFPAIGIMKYRRVGLMRDLEKELRNIIIIWTCRSGNYLLQMKEFLIKNEIPFDFINENPMAGFQTSNKIFAHEYWDDRAVEVE